MNQEDTEVFSFDPCHLQHNVVNARMWQSIGEEGTLVVPTNTGRRRINILGALNLRDLSMISTLTEESCNSIRVTDFFMKIREQYLGKRIVIVLDNARYNHANYTITFVEWYNIVLVFLPPYCPNLSLIERVWKFSKKELVHNIYYEDFVDFKKNTNDFFDNLRQHQDELETLLTRKFEIIKKA